MKTFNILSNMIIALVSQITQGFQVQFSHGEDSSKIRQAFQDIQTLGE